MADYTQRVIWTALPTGRNKDFLTLTALVSPRLNVLIAPVETLDKWPDFMDWAVKMLKARFEVSFAGVSVKAERISQPDPDVWKALFTLNTVVRNHQFEDKRGSRVLSYPVTTVHDFVGETYGELGLLAGDELPLKSELLHPVIELARPFDDKDLQSSVLGRLGRDGERQDFPGVGGAFTLQEVYHMPLAPRDLAGGRHVKAGPDDPREDAEWRQHKFVDLPSPMDFAGRVDFHEIVSALDQYPYLLRKTGLAVDLRIRASDLPAGPQVGQLWLDVKWKPGSEATTGVETLEDGRPMTITQRHDPIFAPLIKGSSTPISRGMLNLGDERLRLIQMDVDGAGIKLRNMARNLLRSAGAGTKEQEQERAGAPTLRTAGLQLVELNRHLSLHKAFERSGEMNDAFENGDPIEFYAEDLVRGYHADILDQTANAPWRSLCRRDSIYDLLNSGESALVEDEEGLIRLGAQEAIDQSEPQFQNLVKLAELLFSWSGWSLTAPRPGLAVGIDDTPQPSENSAPPGLPLETSFSVRRGSLPTLRFGHEYRARVRLVDLAGNCLPLIDGDRSIPHEASAPQTFRRFEAVLPPANALVEEAGTLERPDEGESMGRMAIRSLNETPPDNLIATGEETRRHVVPPRTSAVMAEQHGLLDDAAGRPDPALYGLLASRDGNLDQVDVLHADPLTGTSDIVKYSVGKVNFSLPYLPDGLARTAVLRLDFDPKDQPTLRLEAPYYDGGAAWPDAAPFKIRLFEDGAAVVHYEAATRTLHVPLVKADVMRVRISHALTKQDLEQMAVWDLMKQRPGMTAALEAALSDMALRGEHWMLTPWLEMELVHAVQKPLVQPQFQSLGATRPLHDTTATIHYITPIHAKSTDKVELWGHWREPSDVPAEGEPRVLNQSGAAFEERLSRGSCPNGLLRTTGPHAFGDTRYRRVTYRMEAPTRFREFMPASIRQTPELMKLVSEAGVAFVPNGTPPPAPEIVEITPTFGWTRAKGADWVSSYRSGGGLRVWLRRPWFSTGFGEMLGVLVASDSLSTAQITGPKARFVTQWGVDPIWRSGVIDSPSPTVSAFPLRLLGGPIPAERSPEFVPDEERQLPSPFPALTNLELPESGGTLVNVAAHPVCYDPKRQLYYCDIVTKPGKAYYPFVRLALARFHPISTGKAHLSPAVTADYMQLAPDRFLVMSKGGRAGTRKLKLYGHSYTRSPLKEEHPRMSGSPVIRVELQKKNPNLEGDIAWQAVERSAIDHRILYPVLAVEVAPILQLAEIKGYKKAFSEKVVDDLLFFERLSPPLMWETTFRPPRKQPGEEWRVMVMEYERHAVDSDRSPRDDSATDPALRLVFAEAFAL